MRTMSQNPTNQPAQRRHDVELTASAHAKTWLKHRDGGVGRHESHVASAGPPGVRTTFSSASGSAQGELLPALDHSQPLPTPLVDLVGSGRSRADRSQPARLAPISYVLW